MLAYCSVLSLHGSADEVKLVWAITLTEYMFMAGAIFVVNGSDGLVPVSTHTIPGFSI